MSVSAVAIRARAIGAASKAGLLAMAQSSESWPGKDGFSFWSSDVRAQGRRHRCMGLLWGFRMLRVAFRFSGSQ